MWRVWSLWRLRRHAPWRDARMSVIPLVIILALAGCSVLPPSSTSQATPTAESANAQDTVSQPPPTPTSTGAPILATIVTPASPPAPLARGRVILVSLSRQQLYAYQNGALVFTFTVETGRPQLPTPTGVYHVFLKDCSDLRWTSNYAPTRYHNVNCVQHNGDRHQAMFRSPWPKGSPNWYAPTHINYALEFKGGGFYLHDAWWHATFGPGSNVPHRLSNGTWETGSHGCVGMRIPDAERLYAWAPIGTPVYVRANV